MCGRSKTNRKFRGLTLLETSLATMIVGVAVTAIVQLAIITTQQNDLAQRQTVGVMLAENIREMTASLPFCDPAYGTTTFGPEPGEVLATYNDVDDFDGFDSTVRPDLAAGSPIGPVDANRQVITLNNAVPADLVNFRQQVIVTPVDPNNLGTTFPKPDTTRSVVRVNVVVSYKMPGNNWVTVTSINWLKSK